MTEDEFRGFLTKTEKEFLRTGETNHPTKTRQQIRNRIRAALRDMELILDEMDERDVELAFKQKNHGTQSEAESGVDSEVRKDAVKTIAFLYKALETVDGAPLQVLEEGIAEGYERQHPGDILDEVSITIKSEPLTEAASKAEAKLDGEVEGRLTSTEIRAFHEVHPGEVERLNRHLRSSRASPPTEMEVHQILTDEPERIEEGLEVVAVQPRLTGGAVPDLLAQDAEGKAVLVEVASNSEEGYEQAVGELKQMLPEYGGSENARGIIVVSARTPRNLPDIDEDGIELRNISV